MNLDAYERDCELACHRFLEEKKQEIREGHTAATEIWIETPPLSSYLEYRYIPNNRYEDQQGYLIMKSWQARASSELSDFWEEYKRNRRAERAREEEGRRRKQAEEDRALEAERRREEEEEREEEEKRRRKEEARRRAEAKRQEQDKKNREALSKIQTEWKEKHSSPEPASQPPQMATDSLFCSGCGAPNAKSVKFCTKCGTPLQFACPSCGQLVRVGSKFCTKCGTKLT